jgi:hypothetical protein
MSRDRARLEAPIALAAKSDRPESLPDLHGRKRFRIFQLARDIEEERIKVLWPNRKPQSGREAG